MGDGTSGELSVEAYARIQVALSDPEVDAATVLMTYGLDERQWTAIDRDWQARIAAAESADDGVPALVVAYADAFAKAQRARATAPLSFERYVELTKTLSRSREVPSVFERARVSFEQYMAAHAHFAAEMLSDADLAARFARAVQG